MTKQKIKVIIADNHTVYRDGLRLLLQADDAIEVVAEASNGFELIQMASQYIPDVILTDLIMPGMDGIQAIREIHKTGMTRLIALSGYDSDHLIVEALEAGAMGYVVKNAMRGEITSAIKEVYNLKVYFCQATAVQLAKHTSKNRFNPHTRQHVALFSEKEKEIICLICEEKSSAEIAKVLCLSRRTVEGIRTKILAKMNVKTPLGVAMYAVKNSIYFLKPSESTPPSIQGFPQTVLMADRDTKDNKENFMEEG